MPKILLCTFEDHGGIGRYVDAVARTLPEVEVAVVASGAYWPMLQRMHGAEQVWVHHVLPVGTAALASGRPYVVFLHGMDFALAQRNAWKRWLTRQVLRRAKAVVTNSHALAAEAAAFARIAVPMVVHPCVDDALLEAAAEARAPRAAGHALRLLTVARLVARKGVGKVLAALRELPNTEYDVVGDGPERAALAAEVVRLGLERRVRMHGAVTDAALAAHYAAADVFVLPASADGADREGFGTVYLEANLFGVPAVAVDAPGVDEAVLHRRTGILIEDTHEALVAALLELHAAPLRAALGDAGRTRVRAEFTREAQFGKLRQLL